MSLFKKLFGKQPEVPKQDKAASPEESKALPSLHTIELLLEYFGGIAYEKQIRFHETLGNLSWEFDMQKGQIVFGGEHRLPAQIIGTYSKSQETFMWSWANVHSNIPDYHLKLAKAMKEYGEDNGVVEFFDPTFAADLKLCHTLCLIAVGMFDSSCYYFADFGQGLLLLSLSAPVVDAAAHPSAAAIIHTFPQLISGFEINHRPSLLQYLKTKGFEVEEAESEIKAKKGEEQIKAQFDDQGRMVKLTSGNASD